MVDRPRPARKAGLFVWGRRLSWAVLALGVAVGGSLGLAGMLAAGPRDTPIARPLGEAAPLRLRAAEGVELVAVLALSANGSGLGGLSAMRIEGEEAILASDRGTVWRATLERDTQGRIVRLTGWRGGPIAMPGAGRAEPLDVESITRGADGQLLLTTEDHHRLVELDADGATVVASRDLPLPLSAAPVNEGVEALVDLPDGRLLAIAEGLWAEPGIAVGAIIDPDGGPDGAAPLGWRTEPGHKVTDAARYGSRLFVVERRVSFLNGISAVVKEASADEVRAGVVIQGTVVARLDAVGFGANLEGIAAGPAAGGGVFLYLVSDDDFGILLPIVLVQLRLR